MREAPSRVSGVGGRQRQAGAVHLGIGLVVGFVLRIWLAPVVRARVELETLDALPRFL